MRNIVTIKFGSHLYGTTTPASDLDFKSVYVPSARDILLQKVKGSINKSRQKAEKEKNLPGEMKKKAIVCSAILSLHLKGRQLHLIFFSRPNGA